MKNNLKLFKTFMWPRKKIGKIGFYNKYENDTLFGNIIEGDFTRANTTENSSKSGRTVVDADGTIRELVLNEPTWTYPIGGSASGDPYLSFLPSANNTIQNSKLIGATLPITNWINNYDGIKEKVESIFGDGDGASAVKLTSVSEMNAIQTTSQTFSNGKTYNISILIESQNYTTVFRNILRPTGGFSGVQSFLLNGRPYGIDDIYPVGETGILEYVITMTADSTNSIMIGCGNGLGSVTGTLVFSRPQMIEGERRASFIPTNINETLTRQWDISVTDLNSVINRDSLSWLTQFKFKARGRSMRLTDVTTAISETNGLLWFCSNTSGSMSVAVELPTVYVISFTSDPTEFNKHLLVFEKTSLKLYQNGILIGTQTYTSTSLSASVRYLTSGHISESADVDLKRSDFTWSALSDIEARKATLWTTIEKMAEDLNYNNI